MQRLAVSLQQEERSLLKWNLILAARNAIIASLKVSHSKYLERLAISIQQVERSLLKWNLILADRDDIIASLKVRHLNNILRGRALSQHQHQAAGQYFKGTSMMQSVPSSR
jgi:hypothetical protein